MRVFGVYDYKGQMLIGSLQLAPTDAVAIRAFSDAMQGDQQLARHPEDYCLVFLGVLDEEFCTIDPEPSRAIVMDGRAVMERAAAAMAASSGNGQ